MKRLRTIFALLPYSAVLTFVLLFALATPLLLQIPKKLVERIREQERMAVLQELREMYKIDRVDYEVTLLPADRIDRPSALLEPEQLHAIETLKRRIEERYDISIKLFDPEVLRRVYNVDANPYPASSLEKHLSSLETWLNKYPRTYIQQTGLKTIYFFKGWEKNGVQTSGFLLDKTSIGMEATERILHHELFHVADINDGGIRNENGDWVKAKEDKVTAAVYEVASLKAIEGGAYIKARPFGYASSYGKLAGIDEDQATVVETLMTRPNILLAWAANEPPLEKAVNYVKMFYYTRSDGKMDEEFWAKLKAGEPFDGYYWQTREEQQDFVRNDSFEQERQNFTRILAARQDLREGRKGDAVRIFEEVIAQSPETTAYVNELGRLYESQKDFTKAIALYEQQLIASPSPHAHLLLAINHKSLGHAEKAVHHYTQAYDQNFLTDVEMEDFRAVYRTYAKNLKTQGQSRKLENAYERILSIFGKDATVQKELDKLKRQVEAS